MADPIVRIVETAEEQNALCERYWKDRFRPSFWTRVWNWLIWVFTAVEPAQTLLVGRKVRTVFDAGYYWAPYLPLHIDCLGCSKVILLRNQGIESSCAVCHYGWKGHSWLDGVGGFYHKKGLRTRYAKKLLNPELYGNFKVINVDEAFDEVKVEDLKTGNSGTTKVG